MRRFFLKQPLKSEMVLQDENVHYISNVLRMRQGDPILVVGIDGQTGQAVISRIDRDSIVLSLRNIVAEMQEPPLQVVLAQGLTKHDKMEYIIQKAVELGVHAVIPMLTEHCVVRYDEKKMADRCCRWQKIATEAAQQSRRSGVPAIGPIRSMSAVLTEFERKTEIYMLYEGRTPQGIKSALQTAGTRSFLLLVGPEGGFSSREVSDAANAGARIVTMGPRILRTETASLAALSVIMYEYGDLGG
ncbi:alpha/beta knot methyltransferases [Lucifera butyrica]|uniref:Ribosomal RNA small subunit methyltransferase E n=1 Tax=Lucifera butyrica TaxID=1351585 RepID=A0A498R4Q0_9FIRM|nr:16S rRNA (uracil(1498)-N(3))-methyltransferase [Lucifera butyrica]VBB06095.1 alpha/beta knot methyltransferases [Lucifera butyrica]